MGDKEWFIVHVSIAQNRSALTELSSKLHRTVYDRIKSEFGTGKREKLVSIKASVVIVH